MSSHLEQPAGTPGAATARIADHFAMGDATTEQKPLRFCVLFTSLASP